MPQIISAQSPAQIESIRQLFREYAEAVAAPICFAGFEAELNGLPGRYAPPGGGLLLAPEAGCVAWQTLDAETAEMKRLYVRPPFRGTGLGRALAVDVIAAARQSGLALLRLDTLPTMQAAIALYSSLGFVRRGAYSAAPTPGALFFELRLA